VSISEHKSKILGRASSMTGGMWYDVSTKMLDGCKTSRQMTDVPQIFIVTHPMIQRLERSQKHKNANCACHQFADVACATSRRDHQFVSPGAKYVLRRLQHANDDSMLSAAFGPKAVEKT